MAVRLRLTGDQLQVANRLMALIGAGTYDGLAAEAVVYESERPFDPRWRQPRPPRGGPSRRPRDARLDAILPAASGVSLALAAGQRLRVQQVKDGQCADLGVYAASGSSFSAARTRAAHGINPTVGAALWSTAPEVRLMSIVTDTAPGHDLCFPPCSEHEYEQHSGIGGHMGCAELHAEARARHDPGAPRIGDDVLNLWLPSAVADDGRLRWWPAACRRGDFVELQAETDVVVTLSACPDDLFGSSQYEPGPLRVIVSGAPDGDPAAPRLSRKALPAAPLWPSAAPASAIARHELRVSLADAELGQVDQLVAGGWLGSSRAQVLRALIFRLHEGFADSSAVCQGDLVR
jgi:uncharacterized protein